MILELAKLEIAQRHRDTERRSLARLARENESQETKLNLLQRLERTRRRTLRTAA